MILPDLITQHARSTPEKPAFFFRGEEISYAVLEDRILRCAGGLRSAGIRKGDTFAVVLRNCPEFVILAMALSRLGAVIVPVNFLETPERITLILKDAEAVGILTAREFHGNVLKAVQKSGSVKHLYLKDGALHGAEDFATLLAAPALSDPEPVLPDDLMMLLYTSGTTGLPKGVMLSHKNFLSNVEQCLATVPLKTEDRFLCLLPMFHSFAWTTCVLIPLHLRAPIVIMETLLPFDPVIKAIWRHKVTVFVGVPPIFAALAARVRGLKALLVRVLNPVRLCVSGAAPLPRAVQQAFEKNLRLPILEGYGLTETAPVATLNPLHRPKTGTVGIPLPGVSVDVRDGEGRPVPRGEVGEIWIRGDNVMKGYYRNSRETKAALTPDGWLITGDLGWMDQEDYLTIADRKNDLIIIKGFNVYPQEIEGVIAQMEAVKEVAVVGKLDPHSGEEIIRAFITVKEEATVEKSDIFAYCRKNLAPFKRPKDIIFMKELPKNALQKVLKKDLRHL